MAADRYDLRPSSDQDTNSYAALPGTEPDHRFPINSTKLKSKLVSGVAGCHPSRWLYELLNNNFTTCDLFDRARAANLDSKYDWQHTHRLVLNGNQNCLLASSRMFSFICADCHFHFVLTISWDEAHADCLCNAREAGWPLSDSQFPWHHLVWAATASDQEITESYSKYYPLLAREHFVCSAPPCTLQLTLEVSQPRMGAGWIDLLLDHEAIKQNLALARENEPGRYEGATDDWAYQGPLNLNTYLKNLLESEDGKARSISKRNKRFAVLFGPRCFEIFRRLEFREEIAEHDGVDEGSFNPVTPPPPKTILTPTGTVQQTELGTYRAYIEDVRSEVQCLIQRAGQTPETLKLYTTVLHNELQCKELPHVANSPLVDLDRYKLLGVLPFQARDIVVNAYKRQWDRLPDNRRALVDALMSVANDSSDVQLQDYAMTQSSVFDSQAQQQGSDYDDGIISQALNFLGLQPPNNYSPEALIHAYRQKLVRDPEDAITAKTMLSFIAQGSADETYQTLLLSETEGRMTLETSRAVLGLGSSTISAEEVSDVAKAKLAASAREEGRKLYLDALDTIAESMDSVDLRRTATTLRVKYGIPAPAYNGAVSRPVDFALPVGLDNIGNTCYLNSLLQYLYTVKAVRDVVLNYEDYRLDLSDAEIQARRLGGNKMQMDRGEAVVAQAFVSELADLFKQLKTSEKTATRPSQRLANAVLLSTHSLLEDAKAQLKASSTNPPPLPARPSPEGTTKDTPDIEMADVTKPFSLDGNSSSDTLVGSVMQPTNEDAFQEESSEKDDTSQTESSKGKDLIDMVEVDTDRDGSTVHVHPDAKDQQMAASEAEVDVTMIESEETEAPTKEPTIDERVLDALEHQKRSSGTDQQDVEEVIGSMINRLQAAIKPSHIDDKTGIQFEKIMETFFVTTVNYTKKFGEKEYQHETSYDRSITAFPAPDGPCSIYDALGRNFDQQIIEESRLSRYTAIKTLPPVLHVLIQRSQSIGSKNGNAVSVPETLYLDRYMDAPHDSAVFRRRVEDWAITSRIADLKAQRAKLEKKVPVEQLFENITKDLQTNSTEPASLSKDVDDTGAMQGVTPEENWDFDGPLEDGFVVIKPPHLANAGTNNELQPSLPSGPGSDMPDLRTGSRIEEMLEEELAEKEKTLEAHLEGSRDIPYKLHAVICHRGHLSSGHYWVWIHDFEEDVWRWYNDADVKDKKGSTNEVLESLSTSGEPYYLCYVRDGDKEDYVDVPKRTAS